MNLYLLHNHIFYTKLDLLYEINLQEYNYMKYQLITLSQAISNEFESETYLNGIVNEYIDYYLQIDKEIEEYNIISSVPIENINITLIKCEDYIIEHLENITIPYFIKLEEYETVSNIQKIKNKIKITV